MAWTTPKTNFISGEVLTATQMNSIGSNLVALINAGSTTKTDKYSASVAGLSFTPNVTGLEVTITPSTVTSKILLVCSLSIATETGSIVGAKLMRDVTAIAIGDAEGSRARVSAAINTAVATGGQTAIITTLDSPGTIAAITYGVQLYNNSGLTRTLYLNQGTDTTTNSGGYLRTVSSITAIEIPV